MRQWGLHHIRRASVNLDPVYGAGARQVPKEGPPHYPQSGTRRNELGGSPRGREVTLRGDALLLWPHPLEPSGKYGLRRVDGTPGPLDLDAFDAISNVAYGVQRWPPPHRWDAWEEGCELGRPRHLSGQRKMARAGTAARRMEHHLARRDRGVLGLG